MTGFKSKRQATQANMYEAVPVTIDDAQGYIADCEAALKIAYEIGFENGKKAQPEQQAEPFSAVSIHATQTAWKMGYEAAKAEMQPAQAAAELRRLHESNQELLAALKACGDDKEVVNATIESQGELE